VDGVQIGTRVSIHGDWSVTHVVGDLDMASAPALRATVLQQLDDGWTHLVLDLTGSDFIDSSGVGVIVGFLRRIRSRAGQLELVVPLPEQRRIFELCELDRIFTLHADLEAAVAPAVPPAPVAAPAADGNTP